MCVRIIDSRWVTIGFVTWYAPKLHDPFDYSGRLLETVVISLGLKLDFYTIVCHILLDVYKKRYSFPKWTREYNNTVSIST